MANWDPNAANALMMFAQGHNLQGLVAAFQNTLNNWADHLAGPTNSVFQFGNYRVEATGDAGEVQRLGFDM